MACSLVDMSGSPGSTGPLSLRHFSPAGLLDCLAVQVSTSKCFKRQGVKAAMLLGLVSGTGTPSLLQELVDQSSHRTGPDSTG